MRPLPVRLDGAAMFEPLPGRRPAFAACIVTSIRSLYLLEDLES